MTLLIIVPALSIGVNTRHIYWSLQTVTGTAELQRSTMDGTEIEILAERPRGNGDLDLVVDNALK